MTHRRVGLAFGVTALVVALAGCGGSKSTSKVSAAGPVTPTLAAANADARPRHAAHRTRVAHRRSHAKPLVAHGGTAKFAATATGRPGALKSLAASVPGGTDAKGNGANAASAVKPVHFAHTGGTDEAFVASADAVCTNYRATVRGIAAKATTVVAQEGEMQDLVNATSAALKRLEALSPPTVQAAPAGKYIALVGSSVRNFVLAQSRSSSTSEAAGTASETQDMNDANASSQEALSAQATAHRLGLRVCGSSGAEWL